VGLEVAMMETWEPDMDRFEELIRNSEGISLRVRWECGHYLLTLKKGKQLPRGVLDRMIAKYDRSRQDLQARMRFAAKYPTEAEVANALATSRRKMRSYGPADPPKNESGEPLGRVNSTWVN
jgi:hypothetical protein